MNRVHDKGLIPQPSETQVEEATRWFLRTRSESAQGEDLLAFKDWIESDSRNRLAYQRVTETWGAVGNLASAPEVMIGRRDALDDARRAARRRWSVRHPVPRYAAFAASLVLAAVGALGWLYAQGIYATDVGERRALMLEDGSVVTLDAKSRVRVQYEASQRVISLERGQARFDVAKDPTRPFRVNIGNQAVIALGTQFNVELVAGNMLVSMIEGHVAVTGIEKAVAARVEQPSSLPGLENETSRIVRDAASPSPIEHGVQDAPILELRAGEGLRVRRSDGQAVVLSKIDVYKATAWQSGRMFFDNEPLSSAVERINRYSQRQIKVDPSVSSVGVSGVFNAGEPDAFVEAISAYFPIHVERSSDSEIRLTARK